MFQVYIARRASTRLTKFVLFVIDSYRTMTKMSVRKCKNLGPIKLCPLKLICKEICVVQKVVFPSGIQVTMMSSKIKGKL